MLVKFLAHGTGSAQTAADYLHARDGQPGRHRMTLFQDQRTLSGRMAIFDYRQMSAWRLQRRLPTVSSTVAVIMDPSSFGSSVPHCTVICL